MRSAATSFPIGEEYTTFIISASYLCADPKLVSECLKAKAQRDDEALLETMKAILSRLKWNLEVSHPVTPKETISKGSDDAKVAFFRDRLEDAIGWLKPLESSDTSKTKVLDVWDKMFNTDFFSNLDVASESKAEEGTISRIFGSAASILGGSSASAAKSKPVSKEGSNRYA